MKVCTFAAPRDFSGSEPQRCEPKHEPCMLTTYLQYGTSVHFIPSGDWISPNISRRKCPFRGNGLVYSDYKAARPESAPFASCPSLPIPYVL